MIRYALRKKIRHYLGIFPKRRTFVKHVLAPQNEFCIQKNTWSIYKKMLGKNSQIIPYFFGVLPLPSFAEFVSTLAYHSLTSSMASAELSWHGRCVPQPTASAPPRVRLLRAAWIEEPVGHLTRNLIKFGEFWLGKVFCRIQDICS